MVWRPTGRHTTATNRSSHTTATNRPPHHGNQPAATPQQQPTATSQQPTAAVNQPRQSPHHGNQPAATPRQPTAAVTHPPTPDHPNTNQPSPTQHPAPARKSHSCPRGPPGFTLPAGPDSFGVVHRGLSTAAVLSVPAGRLESGGRRPPRDHASRAIRGPARDHASRAARPRRYRCSGTLVVNRAASSYSSFASAAEPVISSRCARTACNR